jgi:hypothetical protein
MMKRHSQKNCIFLYDGKSRVICLIHKATNKIVAVSAGNSINQVMSLFLTLAQEYLFYQKIIPPFINCNL